MSDRIKVQAVRAANGRIQGWAINQGSRELYFFGTTCRNTGNRNAHTIAMTIAQRVARGAR
ncbi:hypothetical protein AWC21_24030 [Mycolicibacterium peregrinum]|nr:hypothetical protein AWC21_24030 [Mycolicibacterium peregrinum]